MPLLVTSAAGANGNGYGGLLAFDLDGSPLGAFSDDSRIAHPRGLAVDLRLPRTSASPLQSDGPPITPTFLLGAKSRRSRGLPQAAAADPSRPLSLCSGNGSSCPTSAID